MLLATFFLERIFSHMEQGKNEISVQMQANLEKLRELGYPPYGQVFPRSGSLAEVEAGFAEHKTVTIAGRIVSKREMGKSIFAHLQDGTGRFQVYLKQDAVGDLPFQAFSLLDLGDHVGVTGDLFVTRSGEKTLKVHDWKLLSKAVQPMPEKWHGLQDVEIRYRKRYLDLIANPEVRRVFDQRIAALRTMREFLQSRGYCEVETPMLQLMAGGANANPFKTHYQALSTDMYMRIAPELYLKRLLVGGFDKVFELNRNFRNEGLSKRHSPEFTMIEIYEAYGDMRTIKQLTQDMIVEVAQKVIGTLQVCGGKVDLTPPWKEISYHDAVRSVAGADWFELDLAGARAKAESLGLYIDPEWRMPEITHEVYEKVCEKTFINPTFVTRFPATLVPLAKPCSDDPSLVDVFELEINGCELSAGYSELNDPFEQRRRLEFQSGGDASKVDEDFLTALEHGMPPAGGMGMGIDRLMILLTGVETIRDVILFPHLKPK